MIYDLRYDLGGFFLGARGEAGIICCQKARLDLRLGYVLIHGEQKVGQLIDHCPAFTFAFPSLNVGT